MTICHGNENTIRVLGPGIMWPEFGTLKDREKSLQPYSVRELHFCRDCGAVFAGAFIPRSQKAGRALDTIPEAGR